MMNYTILVTGPPYGTQNSRTAFLFSKALISLKHSLKSVFFYASGVYNANFFINPSEDEFNIFKFWLSLKKDFDVTLNVCMSSSYKRGVLTDIMSKNLGFNVSGNFSKYFNMVGLNDLFCSVLLSDRFMKF